MVKTEMIQDDLSLIQAMLFHLHLLLKIVISSLSRHNIGIEPLFGINLYADTHTSRVFADATVSN